MNETKKQATPQPTKSEHKNHTHNNQKLKELQEALTASEAQVKALEEKVKYSQAELINYRKRKDEETGNLLKFASQDLILDILPVLDNFERAIRLDDNNLSDELSKFLEGFKMIYASLTETLKKYGVTQIEALGKPFDPMLHQALMVDSDEAKEDGIVLDVLLKGYQLFGKVIRPSTVKINQIEKKGDKNE